MVVVVVVFFLLNYCMLLFLSQKRLKSGHLRLRSIQDYVNLCYNIVSVVVQFCFWFNLDFPLFDIHYYILA